MSKRASASPFGGGAAFRGVLPNGMAVLHKNFKHARTLSVQLWVRTGSFDELECAGCGVSHFAEHMLFKGTRRRSWEAISEGLGAAGGVINAYTSCDRTVYHIDIPPANAAFALSLLAEMAFEPKLAQSDFDAERDVILREIDMCKDDPEDRLFDALALKTFPDSMLRFPVIGLEKNFRAIKLADLRRYVARRYAPQNMFLSVCSNLKDSFVFDACKTAFGAFEGAPKGGHEGGFSEPRRGVRGVDIAIKSECDSARSILITKLPKLDFEADLCAELAASALGSGNSALLVKRLKFETGLAEDVSVDYIKMREAAFMQISCAHLPQNCAALKKELFEVLNAVRLNGLDEAQISKAAAQYESRLAAELLDSSSIANKLGELEADFSSPILEAKKARLMRALKPQTFKRRAAEVLPTECSRFGTVYPRKASSCGIALPQTKKSRVRPIKASAEFEERLDCGAKLVMRRFDVPKIFFNAFTLGGPAFAPAGLSGVCDLALSMRLRGAGDMDFAALSEFLDSRGMELEGTGGDVFTRLSISSPAAGARFAPHILAAAALFPRIDFKLFDNEKRICLTDIAESLSDPSYAASNAARKSFFGRHPLASPPLGDAKSVANATAKGLEALWASQFCAGGFAISASGGFEKNAVLDAMNAAFAAARLPAQKQSPAPVSCASGLKKVKSSFNQGVFMLVWPSCGLDASDDEILLYDLLAEYLGGESGLLFEEVREKRALAYSAYCGAWRGFGAGALYFQASSRPSAGAKVFDAAQSAVDALLKNGFDFARLERAKNVILTRRLAALSSASAWGAHAAAATALGKEPLCAAKVRAMLKNASLDALAARAATALAKPFKFTFSK